MDDIEERVRLLEMHVQAHDHDIDRIATILQNIVDTMRMMAEKLGVVFHDSTKERR